MKLFLDLPQHMPRPHAKFEKNCCTSFREKNGQDTEGHSFIIIRICIIFIIRYFWIRYMVLIDFESISILI